MSLFKRKSSSLDPIERQRKNKQTQYYALLDKCLQIPNDDKTILRKCISQYQQSLISLLQKYRKQGPKYLQELQIFLRKYIQKYKIDNPKYPTLKTIKGTQSYVFLQKRRNSLTISFNSQSKLGWNVTNSTKNINSLAKSITNQHQNISKSHQSSQNLEQSKIIIQVPRKNRILTKNQTVEQHRNYEQLIKRRKTQKLKISSNRVSLSIKRQQQLKTNKPQNQFNQNQSTFLISSCFSQVISPYEPIKIVQSNKTEISNNQNIQKAQFLQTMQFRMKIDRQEQEQRQNNLDLQKKPLFQQLTSEFQQKNKSEKFQPYKSLDDRKQQTHLFQIKRKLFDSQTNLQIKKVMNLSPKNVQRQPLSQIYPTSINQNNFQNIQFLKPLQNNHHFVTKFNQGQNQANRHPESFKKSKRSSENSDHKVNQSSYTNSVRNSLFQNQYKDFNRVIKSNNHALQKENLVFQQNNQFSGSKFYLNSQRKKSLILSHRLPVENNASLMNLSVRNQKQVNSGRMIFSHRMQQLISGDSQCIKTPNHISSKSNGILQQEVSSPNFSRERIKPDKKLQFWARIQSTINQE